MHPCKALLKVRDDVQGARNSQSGLDSLLVTKSALHRIVYVQVLEDTEIPYSYQLVRVSLAVKLK